MCQINTVWLPTYKDTALARFAMFKNWIAWHGAGGAQIVLVHTIHYCSRCYC